MDPGGADVFAIDREAFAAALRGANHTLKRSLTDPHLFSGIGNAYSDEILHAAQLSPIKLTHALTDEEVARLFDATRDVLRHWTAALQAEAGDAFPEKVTAFRPGMAVHGTLRPAVPAVRRARPADRLRAQRGELLRACQTGGRLLADRALSRLLREDWPKTLEDLERRRPGSGGPRRTA